MPRIRIVLPLLTITAFAPMLIAQASENTLTTPEQLRRVPPPSPLASAQELETKADELRGDKAYADAIDYYRAALAKQRSGMLHNKIGISLLHMMRYDDAKKEFQRAVKQDKSLAEAHNNLGVIHYVKKNYRQAIKNYRKALVLNDLSASFHSNLATAFFAKKEFDKASEEYARALEIDPDVFDRTSRTGVAIRYASAEDRAHYSYVIAKMFATRGDAERCLLYLRKALEDGYPVQKKAEQDQEFAKLRKDPRFVQLLAQQVVVIPN